MMQQPDTLDVTPAMDMVFNICGFSGVSLYLLVFWLVARGTLDPGRLTKALRGIALCLILIPLFLRWYLSSSLLMIIGICMGVAGGWVMYKRRP
jgi:hypothetical protein